ncbi:hypothetical protein R7D97_16130 [Vibrio sp. Vb5031]|uniref:Uncharacterized protein n=4 Tax=Vibrionaceae TaxID=641 RepID=A0A1B1LRS7_VIBPH|nr:MULTISPECIES: hypothetical protein [Vibrio]ANS55753.1 hypothetical protein [Vibrio parahaemolyticus]EJL6492167.1 hypothetical protein [Vibrio cholerae]EJL6644673.1 hypothetical protein [Vibrio cholerae]MDW1505711.1 hypothetical protein [Vibrio sp. Vb5031]MDW1517762.1 hypothetical protein [Vibrio sp. Vb5035]
MVINRKFHDAMSILIVLCYIDLKHTHIFVGQTLAADFMGSLFTFALIVPVLSIFLRITNRLNKNAKNSPLVLSIYDSKIFMKWRGQEHSISLEDTVLELLHNDRYALEKIIREGIAATDKELPKLLPSPLVVVVTELKFSNLEREALGGVICNAGAIEITFSESNDSSDIELAAMNAKINV